MPSTNGKEDHLLPLRQIELPITWTQPDKEYLLKNNFLFYQLTGKSITDLVSEGGILRDADNLSQHILNLTSMPVEIAFNPDEFFMPGSGNKSFPEHIAMLPHLSRRFYHLTGIKTAAYTTSGAPDYIELAQLHFQATGERLFGRQHQYRLTTTANIDDDKEYVLAVGQFNEQSEHVDEGLWLTAMSIENRAKGLWCVPLLVPFPDVSKR